MKIETLMEKLNITKEEALQLMEDDKAIDKGADLFPLTAEQKKVAKSAVGVGKKVPTVYNFQPKERKADEGKITIIKTLENAVNSIEGSDLVVITNPSRELTFTVNGRAFKLTLTATRK